MELVYGNICVDNEKGDECRLTLMSSHFSGNSFVDDLDFPQRTCSTLGFTEGFFIALL